MDATKAPQCCRALHTSETARVQAGRIGDKGEETGGILRVSETLRKPAAIEADMAAFAALQAAAARDGWSLTRIVAEGAPVYLLRRLRFSEAFHDLDELSAFLGSRGVWR